MGDMALAFFCAKHGKANSGRKGRARILFIPARLGHRGLVVKEAILMRALRSKFVEKNPSRPWYLSTQQQDSS